MGRRESTRRDFVARGIGAGLAASGWRRAFGAETRAADDLVAGIERVVIFNGRSGGTTWFQPRACMAPGGKTPLGVMTLQSVSGSDYFGPVHGSVSTDLGRTWSERCRFRPWGGGRRVRVRPKGFGMSCRSFTPRRTRRRRSGTTSGQRLLSKTEYDRFPHVSSRHQRNDGTVIRFGLLERPGQHFGFGVNLHDPVRDPPGL